MRRVAELSVDQLVDLAESAPLGRPAHLYLRNKMLAEIERIERGARRAAGRFYAVFTAGGPQMIAFFSSVRVLVLGPASDAPGAAASAAALRSLATRTERGFRIVIGPDAAVSAFLDALPAKVRIDLSRSQPFLRVARADKLGSGRPARIATPYDSQWLLHASLMLNEEDLAIPAASVDRGLLRARVDERIAAGCTWITEVHGKPAAKLDVGDEGPAGALIEGVYTEPKLRGGGLARGLVAEVSRGLLDRWPCVGLHVSRANTPAVRAYLAAGFEEVENLRLALVSWK